MEFYLMARTYNIYGGHPSLSLISDFLLKDTDGFGTAISELAVTFHFPHSGPPRPTLEKYYAGFHANLKTLPKIVFRRKRGQMAIDIASTLIDGKDWKRNRSLSLSLFQAGLPEAIAALALMGKRLTANDDFDLDAFLTHCRNAQSQMPSTSDELAKLADDCKSRRAARLAAMSPWERLGLDWRDFHPDSRTILDDPFFWEEANDFAPNGNDTGADLLADYRKWLKRYPTGDPIAFYEQLIRRWGFTLQPTDDTAKSLLDEAAVALAFAEFKLRAKCCSQVNSLALAAIQRQRQQALESVNWSHKDERLKCLDKLETKLANYVAQ